MSGSSYLPLVPLDSGAPGSHHEGPPYSTNEIKSVPATLVPPPPGPLAAAGSPLLETPTLAYPWNDGQTRNEVDPTLFSLNLKAGVFQNLYYMHNANRLWGTRVGVVMVNDTFIRITINRQGEFGLESHAGKVGSSERAEVRSNTTLLSRLCLRHTKELTLTARH